MSSSEITHSGASAIEDVELTKQELLTIREDSTLEISDFVEDDLVDDLLNEILSETRVGHVREDNIDVYVGRGSEGECFGEAAIGERGGLGNPFTVEDYGREKAVELFRQAFEEEIEQNDELQDYVANLQGKTLGCWCQSLSDEQPACHAEVIAEWADKLGAEK